MTRVRVLHPKLVGLLTLPPFAHVRWLSGLEDLLKTLVDARKFADVPIPRREDPGVSILEVLQGVAHGVLHMLGVQVLRDRGRDGVEAPDEMDCVGPVPKLVEISRLRRKG